MPLQQRFILYMTEITAKITKEGKHFEIKVDSDKALALKKTGKGNTADILTITEIFSDIRRGTRVSKDDLKEAFDTDDVYKIAEIIIKNGELLLPMEYKTREREERMKQIVTHIARICIDPRTDLPVTASRIESAIIEAGIRIDEKQTAEQQTPHIISIINKLLPIRIVTKKVSMKIPSQYSARIYGIIKPFIMKEEYLSDGSLSVVLQMTKATQIDIYDKVNSIAHGAIITKDLE